MRAFKLSLVLFVGMSFGLSVYAGDKGNGGGTAKMRYSMAMADMLAAISDAKNEKLLGNLDVEALKAYLQIPRSINVSYEALHSMDLRNDYKKIHDITVFNDSDNTVTINDSIWTMGTERFPRVILFSQMVHKFYAEEITGGLLKSELVGTLFASEFDKDSKEKSKKNAIRLVDYIIGELEKAPDLGIDVEALKALRSEEYYFVYESYLEVGFISLQLADLEDVHGDEVDYKVVDGILVMDSHAFGKAVGCLPPYSFGSSCRSNLSLFLHEMLRLTGQEDDNYQLSSRASRYLVGDQ